MRPQQPSQLLPAKQSGAMPADRPAVLCTRRGSTCTAIISTPAEADQPAGSLFSALTAGGGICRTRVSCPTWVPT